MFKYFFFKLATVERDKDFFFWKLAEKFENEELKLLRSRAWLVFAHPNLICMTNLNLTSTVIRRVEGKVAVNVITSMFTWNFSTFPRHLTCRRIYGRLIFYSSTLGRRGVATSNEWIIILLFDRRDCPIWNLFLKWI